ncbi:MAG TPA: hypothetical protein VGD65_22205 [Chryseosolibacter sp.]
MEQSNHVDVLQLRALLHDLHAHRNDIMIRFRTLGSLWQPSFLRINKVTDSGVILADPQNDKPVILSNLDFVVQFEIDTAFKQFQPNNHYDVKSNLL